MREYLNNKIKPNLPLIVKIICYIGALLYLYVTLLPAFVNPVNESSIISFIGIGLVGGSMLLLALTAHRRKLSVGAITVPVMMLLVGLSIGVVYSFISSGLSNINPLGNLSAIILRVGIIVAFLVFLAKQNKNSKMVFLAVLLFDTLLNLLSVFTGSGSALALAAVKLCIALCVYLDGECVTETKKEEIKEGENE